MKAVNAGEHGSEHVRICVVIEKDETRTTLEVWDFARAVQAIEPDDPPVEGSDGECILIRCECSDGNKPRFVNHDQLRAFLSKHNSGNHASMQ